MTTSTVDFPTWFNLGCYCGLACCMLVIAVNALYTSVRRRGTTRQLAGAIMTCVVSALLLLPALAWYNIRFSTEQAAITSAEVEVVLVYVVLFGCVLPLSVSTTYCLFALPRTSTTSLHIPSQKRATGLDTATVLNPPRHQAGVIAPYVSSEEVPWGWLEYRNGRFQGQQLALKRTIITIGRGEENDIWLDDDMASRNHAELAWDAGQVYVTDCDSLNGVLLNGWRIRNTAIVEPDDQLEIGSHRFFFVRAERPVVPQEQDDPLTRHVWHSTSDLQTDSEKIPLTESVAGEASEFLASPTSETSSIESQDTLELQPIAFTPQPTLPVGVFVLCDGELAGQSFVLGRPVMTLGRGVESDIVINDVSISRRHAQVLLQANGWYVQDLASRNGTKVNDERLNVPRLLQFGDIVSLGNVHLQYGESVQAEEAPQVLEPMSLPVEMPSSQFVRTTGGPGPLRLPSRAKLE
jgi:pSer/pThr/pTyr-binding forkhead associated (FHA) protein